MLAMFCLVLCDPEAVSADAEEPAVGAAVVTFYGYDDCIRLSNEHISVVLCPAVGGRVLEYSLDGKNVLYLPPGDEGWLPTSNQKYKELAAGRFDIGPEKVVNRSKELWWGRWQGEITGDRAAKMVSQADELSGAQLVREFRLDANGSKLECTQTIVNVSDRQISLCHWSRTFAVGNGIAIVPRTQPKARERFPLGWVLYGGKNQISFRPQDDAVRVAEDAIYVDGPPANAKLGFDSYEGKLAYLAPNDLLFAKTFPTFVDRNYNEVAGLTISVWYPQKPMVELEPIGPAEHLGPAETASFTETWYLKTFPFPKSSAGDLLSDVDRAMGW